MSDSFDIGSGFIGSIASCGVYLLNSYLQSSSVSGNPASPPFPVCCSIKDFVNTSFNDVADGIIIYPGFKATCYHAADYYGTYYTIDNTNGTNIVIREFQNIGALSSIKVFYLGREISFKGVSNDTQPNEATVITNYTYPNPTIGSESASLNSGFTFKEYQMLYCGVYLLDYDFGGNAVADNLLPLPCSIKHLSKIGKDNTLDGVILYPGFKVLCWRNENYSGACYEIDNSDFSNDDIMIKKIVTADQNQITSIQVFYKGTEITLKGISNNDYPTSV